MTRTGLTNVAYSYQWVSNDGNTDTDIGGETGSTYEVSDADVGKTIKVRVSFTDDRDNQESLTSVATAAVRARPNSPATGAPTISGTAQVEETLTADTSGITDEDGLTGVSYSYRWIRSDGGTDTDLAGETASTYTVSVADVGKTIMVRVSFTDETGTRRVPGQPGHGNGSSGTTAAYTADRQHPRRAPVPTTGRTSSPSSCASARSSSPASATGPCGTTPLR